METTINETDKYIFSHSNGDTDVTLSEMTKSEYRGVLKLAFYFHFMHQSRNSLARYFHWKAHG